MSDTITGEPENPVKAYRAARRAPLGGRSRKTGPDLSDFSDWLQTLGMAAKPSIHVNGAACLHAVLAVDFGVPFKQPKLTNEQSAELTERMKRATKEIVAKDVNIRVSADPHNGVWWSSVG